MTARTDRVRGYYTPRRRERRTRDLIDMTASLGTADWTDEELREKSSREWRKRMACADRV